MCQVASAKSDFKNAYPTLRHYLDAVSYRFTYKKLLCIMYSYFNNEIKNLSQGYNTSDVQQQPARMRQSGTRFQQVSSNGKAVTNKLDYAPCKTFQTPTKARKRNIEKGQVTKQVQHRTEHCSGHPFEVVDQGLKTKDQRRACFICKTKTKWMCSKCRFYFCMDYKKTSNRDEHLYYTKEKKQEGSDDEMTKIYGKTCFHICHEKYLRKTLVCQPVNEELGENVSPNVMN